MGMQQKLEKAYQAGYKAGEQKASEFAELKGVIQGAQETWTLMENMFHEIKGIGPKTREKLLKSIQEYARKEQEELGEVEFR